MNSTLCSVLVTCLFVFGCSQKEPGIDVISDENCNKLLVRDTNGVYAQNCFGITRIPIIGTLITNSFYRLSNERWTVSHDSGERFKQTIMLNKEDNIQVTVNNPPDPNIISQVEFLAPVVEDKNDAIMKSTIDFLIKEEGFTYKRTRLKDGSDILIKKEGKLYGVWDVFTYSDGTIQMMMFRPMVAREHPFE